MNKIKGTSVSASYSHIEIGINLETIGLEFALNLNIVYVQTRHIPYWRVDSYVFKYVFLYLYITMFT